MKWIAGALGAVAALLGGLWLVQGLGLVRIDPVLCVAECEALEGPSLPWSVAGAVLLVLGITVLGWSLRRR